MVSITLISLSVASSTLAYLPQPTVARMAAPKAGPSLELILSTFYIKYIGNYLTPQRALGSAAVYSGSLYINTERLGNLEGVTKGKATPSRTACGISERVVSMVIPIKVPLALGLLWGVLSPIRYGRKNTLFSPQLGYLTLLQGIFLGTDNIIHPPCVTCSRRKHNTHEMIFSVRMAEGMKGILIINGKFLGRYEYNAGGS